MTRTLQELNFEASLISTIILKHATDKLPYSEEFKWNQFVLRRRIQQPTLADFNQWTKIAEAHERQRIKDEAALDLTQPMTNINDQLIKTGNNSNNNQHRT